MLSFSGNTHDMTSTVSKNRDVGDVNPLKPFLFWQIHSVGLKQCLRECGRVETLWIQEG